MTYCSPQKTLLTCDFSRDTVPRKGVCIRFLKIQQITLFTSRTEHVPTNLLVWFIAEPEVSLFGGAHGRCFAQLVVWDLI